MVKQGFLHFTNAPTEEAGRDDVDPPTLDKQIKAVVLCRGESTFQTNKDQTLQWGLKGTKMKKPRSRGAGPDSHN